MRKTSMTATTTQRLTLRRETLRSLTKDELRLVAGGGLRLCTNNRSGC